MELISLIVAVIALAQPWIYFLWKRYLQRLNLDLLPFDKIEVGFTSVGPMIGLFATIISTNKDIFIPRISVNVIHLVSDEKKKMTWLWQRDQKITNTGEQATGEIAKGFILLKMQPRPIDFVFYDRELDKSLKPIAERLQLAWHLFLSENDLLPDTAPLPSATSFSQHHLYQEMLDALRTAFFWRVGQYKADISIECRYPNQEVRREIRFEILPDEIDQLKRNIIGMIDSMLKQYNHLSPNVFCKIDNKV